MMSNGKINFVISSVHIIDVDIEKLKSEIEENWGKREKEIELFGVDNCSLNYL